MNRKYLLALLVLVFLLAATSAYAIDTCTLGFEASPATMPAERGRLAGVVVGDYFYVMGGWDNTFAIHDDLYRYDLFTDTWDDTLAVMPGELANHCVIAIDRKIHAFGGLDGSANYTNVHYIYDIATDSWSAGANYPLTSSGLMCAEIDGMIYAAGGDVSGGDTADAYEYDPGTDSWAAIASMPTAKGYGRGLAYQGLFYAVGGWNDATLYAYDPDADTWATLSSYSSGIHDPNIIVPLLEYEQDYWFSYGFGPGTSWNSDATIIGYEVTSDYWYTATGFGTMPIAVNAAASANFYNAYFLIAGGFTTDVATKTDALQIFRYCGPYLSSVTPNEVLNYEAEGTVLALIGLHFDDQSEADLYLDDGAKTRVEFDSYSFTDEQNATATLPAGLTAGAYDVVVVNSFWSGPSIPLSFAVRPDGLVVLAPIPEVTAIDPATGEVGDSVSVEITGDHFFGTPTVMLSGPAKADITATDVVVGDANAITCDFDLTGADSGDYDVVVTTDNGDGTLADGFNIPEVADDDTVDDDTGDDDTDDDDTDDDDTDDDDTDDDDDDTTPSADDDDDDDDDDDGCCGC